MVRSRAVRGLRREADVAMMEPTNFGNLDDRPRGGELSRVDVGRILVETPWSWLARPGPGPVGTPRFPAGTDNRHAGGSNLYRWRHTHAHVANIQRRQTAVTSGDSRITDRLLMLVAVTWMDDEFRDAFEAP